MTTPKLEVKNLSKTFSLNSSLTYTVSSISMRINYGEFVSIIGPSGCGKTTLLNILAGLEKQTTGTIYIDKQKNQKLLGKSGYMLQKPLLLPWKTVLENVMLGLTLKRISEKKAKQEACNMLKKFGLSDYANYYPHALSGGMAQRVALLRTILFNNQFLLMDEPFGALDALTRLSMQMWLLDVWQTYKSSVLFVTHDIREAILLSDRIYVLSSSPATIIKEVNINLPRPRKHEFLKDKKTVEIEQLLEQLLLNL
ncbi:MAG: ABC transporter ATP-binding protein [Candidatus Levyibacteriota bacterium]|nr:MAG: ABC transporter ATP-binding protein [Candidatus Levybacteria bacterium]